MVLAAHDLSATHADSCLGRVLRALPVAISRQLVVNLWPCAFPFFLSVFLCSLDLCYFYKKKGKAYYGEAYLRVPFPLSVRRVPPVLYEYVWRPGTPAEPHGAQ